MTRILVTGSDGQLGRNIQEITGNFPKMQFVFKNSKSLDITVVADIESTFLTSHFEYCINCAAYTNVEQAESEPKKAFAINAEGVQKLALACRENDTILIHISTDYVFDGKKNTPYTIQDVTNPINVYGKSKLQGELNIQQTLQDYFIIRTSWLYSEIGKNFYTTIRSKAMEGGPLVVTDDQVGCPTHARHLANYILHLISAGNNVYGIHHFTDGEVMTWYGFAQKILKEIGLANTVRLEKAKNYRTLAARPKYSVLGMADRAL